MNFKPLKHVLNYIPNSIKEVENDQAQLVSWALMALRDINTHHRYMRKIELLTIEDHKAQLPKGIKKILSIVYLPNMPDEKDLSNVFCEKDTGINYSGDCMVYANLFTQVISSNRYDSQRMRYIGNTGKNYFTKDCYDHVRCKDCEIEFSITNNNCLRTSKKSGYICLEYSCEIQNEKGEFLAPAEPQKMWLGLAHFAISQHWLNRTGFADRQLSMRMYREHQQISNSYMREAKGIFAQKALRFKDHYDQQFSEVAILRLPSVFGYKI